MDYKSEIIRIVNGIGKEKGELLCKTMHILEVLPTAQCQRIFDYLLELYFS